MTPDEYKVVSKQICWTLRSPQDPPPRSIEHGSGPWSTPCTNVRDLLRSANGAVLLRGYRLLTVPLAGKRPKRVWKAVSHVVIAHPPVDGTKSKWIYECATAPENIADRKQNYVFVPSSRAHAELTDAQFLTGNWLLGVVIGGDRIFCDIVAADNATRGRERNMISTAPERCIAKRKMVFGFFPHFAQWFRQSERSMLPDSMAELMGFPAVDAEEKTINSDVDFFDEDHIQDSIERNTNALVQGGLRSLRLEHVSLQALYSATQSFDSTRLRWFEHYDELLEKVERVIEIRYQDALRERKLTTARSH